MTTTFARLPRNATSALLAVAMTLALTVFAAGPAGVSIAQAQSCNPQIGIDSPAPDDTITNSATFTGWAVDLSSPAGSGVDSVRLYRDAPPEQGGTGLAVATVGIDRPDVDAANGLTSSGAGWSADVDFSDVPSGPYTVYIYAHTLCGWTYATQNVAVVSSNAAAAPSPSALQISLDSPAQGAMLNNGQTVSITGWAVDPSASGTGVDAVRLFLDGQEGTGTPLGFAQYGKARSDVASMSGNSDWSRSGFDMTWNINGVAPGSHVLYIYAHSLANGGWDYTTLPISVTGAGATVAQNPAPGAPSSNAVVKIESPNSGSNLNGSTILRGYALDCASGTPASTVRVYSGTNTSGRLLGTATVGASTRDLTSICASSGMSGQANVGFTFSVDPSALAGGTQALTVAADTVAGPATATVTFGGGPGANPNTSASGSGSSCSSNPSSAAYSPFAVSCAPGTGSVPNQQAQMQSQMSGQGAVNQPAATSSSYNCGGVPSFQNGANGQQNYAAAANGYASGACTTANGSMYNNQGYNSTGTSYNPNSPYNSSAYANNGYNTYNNGYNTAYNNPGYNQAYNQSYNPNYTNYNNAGYPYNSNGYNGYNGYNNGYNGYNNGYPYNGGYGYNGYTNYNSYNGYNPAGTYYSNPNPYGTSYNNALSYGTNYNGYYGASYNGYGSPYYGGGYNQVPPGYSPNYVYAGNAGTNYGYPGGGYGYNGYTGGYGGYPGYNGGYGAPGGYPYY